MKKFLLLLLIVLGVAVYLESSRYSLRLGGVAFELDPNRNAIDTKTRRFLTDLQYKDFPHAASFHDPAIQEKFDIPKLIEKKFLVKPEHLDIRHFEVLRVDVSPQGSRAKAIVKVTVRLLSTDKVRDVEAVFYWKKSPGPKPPAQWFMDLQSSL
jgi:hypothetical protein